MKEPKNRNAAGARSQVQKTDEFVSNIRQNVLPKSTLILGISGGADSVYLLHRFIQIAPEMRLKLIVAHVNHGLRGASGDSDETFVKNLCKKNHIRVFTKQLKLKNSKMNLEEIGRDERYKFFESLRKKFRAEWVVTAHHLNDNIETLLFNLIRGAHFNGIKAMETTDPSRRLLRPLLGMTKREILQFLQNNRIEYREDLSNQDTDFSRNWLRKEIIPLFSRLNAGFEQTFKETIHNLQQTSHFLEQQSEQWLEQNSKNMQIELDAFLRQHDAFQKYLLTHLYKKTHKSTRKLTNKHLEEILLVLKKRRANTKKEFGPGMFIEVIREPEKSRRYIRLTAKK
jgi:tRNA(Ile)-lysidine synthetase-like protein